MKWKVLDTGIVHRLLLHVLTLKWKVLDTNRNCPPAPAPCPNFEMVSTRHRNCPPAPAPCPNFEMVSTRHRNCPPAPAPCPFEMKNTKETNKFNNHTENQYETYQDTINLYVPSDILEDSKMNFKIHLPNLRWII